MWVIFEGLDKSGKTTLKWDLFKATEYKHIVIDRGPAGFKTFDEVFDRATIEGNAEYECQAKLVRESGMLVVYCAVPEIVAKQRLDSHCEVCPYDYSKAQELYNANVREMYNDVLVLDTSKLSREECIEKIVDRISNER